MNQPATCQRCGARLDPPYRTHLVHAAEQLLETSPDGSGLHAVLRAAAACSWNCLAVLAAQEAGPDADAAVLVVAERERQVTAEGWAPEHDDTHDPGDLASAGIAYAGLHARTRSWSEWPPEPDSDLPLGTPYCWPWDREWWKPKDELRDLVRAAALIAAEADRLQRAKRRDRERAAF